MGDCYKRMRWGFKRKRDSSLLCKRAWRRRELESYALKGTAKLSVYNFVSHFELSRETYTVVRKLQVTVSAI